MEPRSPGETLATALSHKEFYQVNQAALGGPSLANPSGALRLFSLGFKEAGPVPRTGTRAQAAVAWNATRCTTRSPWSRAEPASGPSIRQ